MTNMYLPCRLCPFCTSRNLYHKKTKTNTTKTKTTKKQILILPSNDDVWSAIILYKYPKQHRHSVKYAHPKTKQRTPVVNPTHVSNPKIKKYYVTFYKKILEYYTLSTISIQSQIPSEQILYY